VPRETLGMIADWLAARLSPGSSDAKPATKP
jgi:hypothetical protein